ncbi:MAG: lyase family protein, partial [Pseudomonadota bacterium]
MTFSLFDHPHFAALLGNAGIAGLFTPEAEVAAMLRFEAALAEAEAELGVIPRDAAAAIAHLITDYRPRADILAQGVARDGLTVPTLVQHLRELVGEEHGRHLHFGATSQDVMDSGLMLRLKDALVILRRDLGLVVERLTQLDAEQGAAEIMGRTRMQRALPIAFSDRLATWAGPLKRQLVALNAIEREVLAVQFGGP